MHVQCSACGARYVIADEKIPIQGARVRCRKCQAVFSVERGAAATPPSPAELPLIPPTPQEAGPAPPASASPPQPPQPQPQAPPPQAGAAEAGAAERVAPTEIERFATAFASSAVAAVESSPAASPFAAAPASAPVPAPATQPAAAPASTGAPQPAAASAAPSSSSAGIPEGLPEAERLKHERARRLARVLASDIAIYNKEKRDRGIQEGNLVAVLGYEIKKSWEVYKERVTAEMANSTPYFRDALNEMLAEGKKVF